MAAGKQNKISVGANLLHVLFFFMGQREVKGNFNALCLKVRIISFNPAVIGAMHNIETLDICHILFRKALVVQHLEQGACHGVHFFRGTNKNPVIIDNPVMGGAVRNRIGVGMRIVNTDFIQGFFHVFGYIIVAKTANECSLCAQKMHINRNVQGLAAGIHNTGSQVFINHAVSDTDYFYHNDNLISLILSCCCIKRQKPCWN